MYIPIYIYIYICIYIAVRMAHKCTRHYILHSHAPLCRCFQDKVDLAQRERFYPFIPHMNTTL